MQEKLARLDEIEMKLNYKDKILKDKIEELKKLRQQNIDLQVTPRGGELSFDHPIALGLSAGDDWWCSIEDKWWRY